MRHVYQGVRLWDGEVRVYRNTRGMLPVRLDLCNHRPMDFEWGHGGSGPAQLALAILANHLCDDERAVRLHQAFKRRVIAVFPRRGWTLTPAQIDAAIAEIEAEMATNKATEAVDD